MIQQAHLPCGDQDPSGFHPPEIHLENLQKSFADRHVLQGIDLTIDRGQIVAMVGSSGCGKTVLLEHMIGNLQPDRGHVWIANHESPKALLMDLATLDDTQMDQIRIHWAVVFQRNALFSGTVYENIALWLREIKRLDEQKIRDIAAAAVDAVGLSADTILEVHRDDLSGGMAKRVAVARAMAMDPAIMFYDEPTTGLDPQHASQIHDLICRTHLRQRAPGTPQTTFIITHDKDLLHRLQPRVVMLHKGRIFFDGPYHDFKKSTSPIIQPYFGYMPQLQRRTV